MADSFDVGYETGWNDAANTYRADYEAKIDLLERTIDVLESIIASKSNRPACGDANCVEHGKLVGGFEEGSYGGTA